MGKHVRGNDREKRMKFPLVVNGVRWHSQVRLLRDSALTHTIFTFHFGAESCWSGRWLHLNISKQLPHFPLQFLLLSASLHRVAHTAFRFTAEAGGEGGFRRSLLAHPQKPNESLPWPLQYHSGLAGFEVREETDFSQKVCWKRYFQILLDLQ